MTDDLPKYSRLSHASLSVVASVFGSKPKGCGFLFVHFLPLSHTPNPHLQHKIRPVSHVSQLKVQVVLSKPLAECLNSKIQNGNVECQGCERSMGAQHSAPENRQTFANYCCRLVDRAPFFLDHLTV